MAAFRILAFLSPMAVGFAVPFVLALRGRPWIRLAAVAGVVALVLLVAAVAGGHGLGEFLALLAYLSALGLLLGGLFAALRSARVPPVAAQVLSSAAVCAMTASIFCSDPFLKASDSPGDLVPLFGWLEPMFAVSSAIGAGDVLHYRRMYGLSRLADYGLIRLAWWEAALGLALLGGGLVGLAQWRRLLKRRGAAPPSPPATGETTT